MEGSLFLRRGKDEYELFAQALGSALPVTTDSSIKEGFRSFEESVGSGSKGSDTTEHQNTEIDPQAVSEQESPETSVPKKLTKIDMAGLLKMSSFVGNGDGRESADDYLADVEMAAKCWDATYGQDADKPDGSKILLFRQNLDRDGDAWYWWSCILGESEKKNYSDIKAAFLARYGAEKNRVVSRFNIQNELMCLSQKPGQPIVDYVREAEILSERVPADMNDMLAMAFIRGLAEQESGRRISYHLRDTPEFMFATALRMVRAWYQDI